MPADYKETELMTMRSFWNKYWPGCTEHFLIRIIRESKDYIPENQPASKTKDNIRHFTFVVHLIKNNSIKRP